MTFIWLLSLCDFLFTVNVFSCGVDNGRSRRVESSTLTYSHYSYIYLVTQLCSSPAVQYSTVQSSFNNVKWVENRSDLEYDFDRGTVGALVPEAGLIMADAVVSLLGFSPTTVHWLITHNSPKTNIQAAAALQERIPCRWPGVRGEREDLFELMQKKPQPLVSNASEQLGMHSTLDLEVGALSCMWGRSRGLMCLDVLAACRWTGVDGRNP